MGLCSRRNKLWLIGGYLADGLFVEWKWQGRPYRSRMMLRFGPDEEFVAAPSYDEDVLPKLEFNAPKRLG